VATDGIRLVALDSKAAVVKGASYVTNTSVWTLNVLKLSAAELATVVAIGVEVKGAAGQLGYVDTFVLNYITEYDVIDGAYAPPAYDSLEATDKSATYITNAQAAIGTAFSVTKTTDADFTLPTNDHIQVENDSISVDTQITFVPYESLTLDQFIAL
jgi:hypothetical protein